MKRHPDTKTMEALGKIFGPTGFHLTPVRVCDNCKDEKKEAFIYCVKDKNGKYWTDLCNDCFESLGCKYDEWNEDELPCVS